MIVQQRPHISMLNPQERKYSSQLGNLITLAAVTLIEAAPVTLDFPSMASNWIWIGSCLQLNVAIVFAYRLKASDQVIFWDFSNSWLRMQKMSSLHCELPIVHHILFSKLPMNRNFICLCFFFNHSFIILHPCRTEKPLYMDPLSCLPLTALLSWLLFLVVQCTYRKFSWTGIGLY